MHSILAHLHFSAGSNRPAMEVAAGTLMLQAQIAGGSVIAYEEGELILFMVDMATSIPMFVEALEAAIQEGFGMRGAFVQPVVGTKTPNKLSDFTDRTRETLARLIIATHDHEIATSPKMRSLVELATPEFIGLFETSKDRSSPLLVLSPKLAEAER